MSYTLLINEEEYKNNKTSSRCWLKYFFCLIIVCGALFYFETQYNVFSKQGQTARSKITNFVQNIPTYSKQFETRFSVLNEKAGSNITNVVQNVSTSTEQDIEQSNESTKEPTEFCKLPKMNAWDESIMPFFDPLYGYQAQCKKPVLRTKFEKGVLSALDRNDHCWGSCLTRTSEKHHSKGPWINTSEVFECDVVAVKCSNTSNIDDADYNWLHTQIYEKPEEKKKAGSAGNHTYDILLLVLDSTGSSHADRNLGKTLHYLTEGLDAVRFRYLNKVGINSLPNAIPLFLGLISEEVNRDPIGLPSIYPNFNNQAPCSRKMDHLTTIQDEFTNNGYVTSSFEDYVGSLYSSAGCVGFERSPSVHTNQAFRQYFHKNLVKLKEMSASDTCYTKHHAMFDHLGQFLSAYPGVPKFTTFWDTNLGHDFFMSSMDADTILLNFFIKNRAKLENSFIIFMSDHGFRLGAEMHTRLGALDQINPMLFVVPPRKLQQNEKLMKTLRENSQKLQTHHDVRATLLDILKNQPTEGYTSQKPLGDDNLIGSSFLLHQPGERSCRTLPIPVEYCLCLFDQRWELDSTSDLANDLGKFVTNGVNEKLKEFKISSICNEWKYKSMAKLSKLVASNDVVSYQVQVNVEPNAVFVTSVSEYTNGTRVLGTLDRGDRYGQRGDCAQNREHRLFCDCKS